jgi:hypothetical protein
MQIKQFLAAAAVLVMATVAAAPAALAHGGIESGAGGSLILNPKAPVAGQPLEMTVSVVADDGHPLGGGTLSGEFKQAGQAPATVTFTETPKWSGQYHATADFAAKDWHGRLDFDQPSTRTHLITDVGFTVFVRGGQTYGIKDSRLISWRQAGVTTAPAWTDTATWIVLAGLPILGALWLAAKQGAGKPGAPLRAPAALVPSGLMTLAGIGALAMPFSGYWDIAWHHDQGRDGLLSPPHIGIYGGITLALAAMAIGVWRAGGLKKIKEFPALAFALGAMIVQLLSAPLDELWHRIMGLDISVWAPPHDMLIFGGALSFIGMAAIMAAADPAGKSAWNRIRTATFGLSGLWIMNAFLAEFEFSIPDWHISQSRPTALYPTLLALSLAASLIPVARMIGGRWTTTKIIAVYWVLRALQIIYFLPALNRSQPHFAALALIPAAIAADLVMQSHLGTGRYRFALAGAAAAAAMFALYQPIALILPVKAVTTVQLITWAPLAMVTAGAAGYLAGWLGDFALTDPATKPVPKRRGRAA